MVEVDLNHIYKKYEGNDKYSVNDFDLHIKDKEFIVFVGPSGCGKSTTLRMVAGLEDISKGTLEIDHKVMNDVAPKDRDIAMVFQNYALYPHMSIYDNMAFGLKLRHYKKDEIDKRVKHAADILGLSEYLDKKLGYGFSTEVERVAKNVGVNAKDLVAIMAAESGLNPNAGKGKNAVGLFQFTSSEVLAESGGKLSWAYNANSGLDLNRDGKITKSELAQHAEKMVKQNGEEFYDLYMLG